jgi:hypothetical protein
MVVGILAVMLAAGLVPFSTQAATNAACNCFCGTPAGGAVSKGNVKKASDCQAKCTPTSADPDLQLIGCFTNEAMYPSESDICWTKTQCETQKDGNVWDDLVADCSDDGPGKIKMGHCYAQPPALNVMTVINGESSFNSIGDYISAVYQMLVPFMAIVAVVMIMIGGLQYILARGNPKAITQAKERITKAVIGFVLLLSAYALANLLDPSLTHLRQLRIPLIKEVVLLDANSTCEYLSSVGFGIDDLEKADFKSKECGNTGEVTSTEFVTGNVIAGQWEKGDPCQYSQCSGGGACQAGSAYVSTGTVTDPTVERKPSATCQLCAEVPPESASAANCAAHKAPDESSAAGEGKKFYCEYISGSGQALDSSGLLATTSACVSLGSERHSSSEFLDCTKMRAYTTSGGSSSGGSCRSYDWVQYTYTVEDMSGTTGFGAQLDASYMNSDVVRIFTDLCTSDPCGLAQEGTASGCQAITSSTGLDCVGHSDLVTTSSTSGISGTCYGRVPGSLVNCETGEPISRVTP